jgi:hypothetical protein
MCVVGGGRNNRIREELFTLSPKNQGRGAFCALHHTHILYIGCQDPSEPNYLRLPPARLAARSCTHWDQVVDLEECSKASSS